MSDEVDPRRLVIAIIDFLRNQLDFRLDFSTEDRESLRIAIECLELVYGLEERDPRRRQVRRPLLDMFNQVSNPPSIRDKLQAERLKTEGNEKMSQQLYEEALNAYDQAIALDKYNAIYYCNRAGANIELGRHFDALADCRQALDLNPDYAKALGRMGHTYALMERPERAARCFRQALELEPDNERYRNNLQVAENLAARAPHGEEMMQNLLSSFFGGPGTGTLTIITEVTPRDLSAAPEEHADQTNNNVQQDETNVESTAATDHSHQHPNMSLLGFALPLILGMLGNNVGEHNHTEASAEISEEPPQQVEEVVSDLVQNVSGEMNGNDSPNQQPVYNKADMTSKNDKANN